MIPHRTPVRRVLVPALVGAGLLAGCTTNAPSSGAGGSGGAGEPGLVAVTSTSTACTLSATTAPSGNVVFSVTNSGDTVTEFYLLAQDGLRIVAEVENIGPGLTRDLVLRAAPGSYLTACKPGMKGEGLRAPFTVTDSGADLTPTGADKELIDAATASYQAYVKDQSDQLLVKTEKFAQLFTAGKDEQARALYADARTHWERIEPVAESFGDLDPKMDLREADLEPGQAWTGWHVAEKDLWAPTSGYTALTPAARARIADQLVADTRTLASRTRDLTFTVDLIGNGAKSLLDEVATGKVTGEEEIFSHTDLWDFQANVDGARIAWEGLQAILQRKDKELDATLQLRFAALQKLLDGHRSGEGFVLYNTLTREQVKALSDAVNALSEPLSRLTAAVL